MVEMNEVSNILKNATNRSLLILDEIGRGTSTFDGLSIAWAVVEHIANTKLLGAKTLFATHYHELTELEGRMNNVKNFSIAVKEQGDDIIFLRKIVQGGADKSYGIQVAKLAGVPDMVIDRAKEIVNQLVDNDIDNTYDAVKEPLSELKFNGDALNKIESFTFFGETSDGKKAVVTEKYVVEDFDISNSFILSIAGLEVPIELKCSQEYETQYELINDYNGVRLQHGIRFITDASREEDKLKVEITPCLTGNF